MSPVYFLLLPALVYGKIAVYVDLTADPPLIDVSGHSSILITEEDRIAFKIDEERLKKAVANYSGAQPTDVFVRNSWRNLYKDNNWNEVNRTVKPTLKTITDATVSPQCQPIPEPLSSKNTNMTVVSVWSNTTHSATEKMDYTIVYQSGTLKFSSSWGEKIHELQKYVLPDTSVPFKKCVVNVYLQYEAKLFGYIAANYPAKKDGHHFWAFDVRNVQKKAGLLPTSQLHQEILTIQYFK